MQSRLPIAPGAASGEFRNRHIDERQLAEDLDADGGEVDPDQVALAGAGACHPDNRAEVFPHDACPKHAPSELKQPLDFESHDLPDGILDQREVRDDRLSDDDVPQVDAEERHRNARYAAELEPCPFFCSAGRSPATAGGPVGLSPQAPSPSATRQRSESHLHGPSSTQDFPQSRVSGGRGSVQNVIRCTYFPSGICSA